MNESGRVSLGEAGWACGVGSGDSGSLMLFGEGGCG